MSESAERIDDVAATLAGIARAHPLAVFASSFGAEDMVLLSLIAAHAPADEANNAKAAAGLIQ